MATYDETKLTNLGQLKKLAEKVRDGYSTKTETKAISDKVEGLVSTGGEPNKINTIKVNGTVQNPDAQKAVDIKVPTTTNELTNDSDFQTGTQVALAIKTAVLEAGHASFEVVPSVPAASDAKDNVLYLVKNTDTGYYDIYARISEGGVANMLRLDDVSVDLSNYVQGPASAKANNIAVFNDATGKVLKNSGFTIATSVPANAVFTDTTYDDMGAASASEAGTHGLVPAPAKGDQNKFLRADGKWIVPTNTTYKAVTAGGADGLMSGADKSKLDGMVVANDADVTAMITEVFG